MFLDRFEKLEPVRTRYEQIEKNDFRSTRDHLFHGFVRAARKPHLVVCAMVQNALELLLRLRIVIDHQDEGHLLPSQRIWQGASSFCTEA